MFPIEKKNKGLHQLWIFSSVLDSYTAISMLEYILSKEPNLYLKDTAGKTALDTLISSMNDQFLYKAGPIFMRHSYLFEGDRSKFITLRCLMIRLLEVGTSTEVAVLNKAMIYCSYAEDFTGIKALVSHGADVNFRDKSGSSILHLCWFSCKQCFFLCSIFAFRWKLTVMGTTRFS